MQGTARAANIAPGTTQTAPRQKVALVSYSCSNRFLSESRPRRADKLQRTIYPCTSRARIDRISLPATAITQLSTGRRPEVPILENDKMKMLSRRHGLFILCTLFFLALATEPPANAGIFDSLLGRVPNASKMDPFELGYAELHYPFIHSFQTQWRARSVKVQSWSCKCQMCQNQRARIEHTLSNMACKQIERAVQSAKQGKTMRPELFDGYTTAYVNWLKSGFTLHKKLVDGNCHSAPEEWHSFMHRCLDLYRAIDALEKKVASRQQNYGSRDATFNLTLELKPLPLKIDFAKGQVKLSKTASIGPLKLGGGAGYKGTRSGVTTLILKDGQSIRHYAIGGRDLSLDIPASRLDIAGKTMTITFN